MDRADFGFELSFSLSHKSSVLTMASPSSSVRATDHHDQDVKEQAIAAFENSAKLYSHCKMQFEFELVRHISPSPSPHTSPSLSPHHILSLHPLLTMFSPLALFSPYSLIHYLLTLSTQPSPRRMSSQTKPTT